MLQHSAGGGLIYEAVESRLKYAAAAYRAMQSKTLGSQSDWVYT